MKAFLIEVNGQRVCLAGIDGPGVLGTTLTWVSRPEKEQFGFAVSRLTSDDCVHSDWNVPKINVGDQVTIKILDVEEFDPPHHNKPPPPEDEEV